MKLPHSLLGFFPNQFGYGTLYLCSHRLVSSPSQLYPATRSAIVCSRECQSIMRIARVFDLPKVRPLASDQRCQDERARTTTTTTTVPTPVVIESIHAGTLEKPIQSDQPSQPQQHVWTQGFEKLLEDPLGLRAFAVSRFSLVLMLLVI